MHWMWSGGVIGGRWYDAGLLLRDEGEGRSELQGVFGEARARLPMAFIPDIRGWDTVTTDRLTP